MKIVAFFIKNVYDDCMKLKSYGHTIAACHVGYICQAIVNNFAPLLFVMFSNTYGVTLSELSLLVLVNFVTQLLVDLFSARFADKIGYRPIVVAAHVMCAIGLVLFSLLPRFMDSFAGMLLSVIVYAVGGGLIETIVSPVVEACPTQKKSSTMSLLHSSYCWGVMLVVLLSTAFFAMFGIGYWYILALVWAVVPAVNAVYFLFVPICTLTQEGESMKIGSLLRTGIFWLFFLLMLCSGASELAVSQWASSFAESGLGISKAVGDIAGPCLFALAMGVARIVQAKFGAQNAEAYLSGNALLCFIGYLIASLVPNAVVSLVGCAICGYAVGAMWPGVYSLASVYMPRGGTALFALLALAGDLGCSSGPSLVGFVAEGCGNVLSYGILAAAAFPFVMFISLLPSAVRARRRKKQCDCK